jgi:hypothetical protein
MFTSDAKYRGTRSRELRPGELDRVKESIEAIKARRARRTALECDGSQMDIVVRLRKMGSDEREIFRFGTRSWLLEAADEIERLRAAVGK